MIMKKGIVVLGAGYMQVPAIKIAKEMGLQVIAVDQNPQAVGFEFADIALPIDIKDHEAIANWAMENKASYNIAAVFSGADVAITAAIVSKRLGLNSIPVDVAVASKNKAIMKKKWLADGVPTPDSVEVDNLGDAEKLAGKFGYPLIVKAIDNSASRGTVIVEAAENLAAAVEAAKASSTTGTCLVEEYVVGEEQSVETVMHKSKQIRAGVVDRHFDFFPYCIETGHTNPTRLPMNIQEDIYRVVEQAALSLGITQGPAKADMILTKKGPMILEMPARLSGGFHSQYTTPLATGMNPIRAVMRQSLGDENFWEDLQERHQRFALCQAIFPPPGRIKAIHGYDEALGINGVEQIFNFKKVGDEILSYQNCADRPCYVIISANAREDLTTVFKKVQQTLIFEME
jgi:biotin carboxylase